MTPGPGAGRWCEGCGKQAPADARFCGACGRPFRAPGGGDSGHPDGDLDSTPKLSGRPTPRGGAGAPAGAEEDVVLFKALPVQTLFQFLVCLLTLGVAWVFLWLSRSHVKYRITTQRLEIRTGIVTVTSRSVDLYRIQDMEVREPFFLRMRGGGDLAIRSLDPGEPEVVIGGIGDVKAVHETLRRLVADERRRLGVRLIEEQS